MDLLKHASQQINPKDLQSAIDTLNLTFMIRNDVNFFLIRN